MTRRVVKNRWASTPYASILRRDEKGVIAFIGNDPETILTDLVHDRISQDHSDIADRIVFLPDLPKHRFLQLLDAAHVVLDTLHYSACSTAYDIFAVDQPLVSIPGETSLSRYTFACYQKMGIPEPVARSHAEYVEIANRLATDAEFRHQLRAKIANRRHCYMKTWQQLTNTLIFSRESNPCVRIG